MAVRSPKWPATAVVRQSGQQDGFVGHGEPKVAGNGRCAPKWASKTGLSATGSRKWPATAVARQSGQQDGFVGHGEPKVAGNGVARQSGQQDGFVGHGEPKVAGNGRCASKWPARRVCRPRGAESGRQRPLRAKVASKTGLSATGSRKWPATAVARQSGQQDGFVGHGEPKVAGNGRCAPKWPARRVCRPRGAESGRQWVVACRGWASNRPLAVNDVQEIGKRENGSPASRTGNDNMQDATCTQYVQYPLRRSSGNTGSR